VLAEQHGTARVTGTECVEIKQKFKHWPLIQCIPKKSTFDNSVGSNFLKRLKYVFPIKIQTNHNKSRQQHNVTREREGERERCEVEPTRVQSLVIHMVGQVPRLQLRWRCGRLLPRHLAAATDWLDERSTQNTDRCCTPSPHDCEHCSRSRNS